jgi:RHS repeat-associated protein
MTGVAFKYTGRRLDAETGLYYYRARYYAPNVGRFLQIDPIGYGVNMNLYAYVGSDPNNFLDPTGLTEIAIDGPLVGYSRGWNGDPVAQKYEAYRFGAQVGIHGSFAPNAGPPHLDGTPIPGNCTYCQFVKQDWSGSKTEFGASFLFFSFKLYEGQETIINRFRADGTYETDVIKEQGWFKFEWFMEGERDKGKFKPGIGFNVAPYTLEWGETFNEPPTAAGVTPKDASRSSRQTDAWPPAVGGSCPPTWGSRCGSRVEMWN